MVFQQSVLIAGAVTEGFFWGDFGDGLSAEPPGRRASINSGAPLSLRSIEMFEACSVGNVLSYSIAVKSVRTECSVGVYLG